MFYDIPKDAWYLDSAMAAAEAGLIKGTNPITFAPNTNMSRGMVVLVLARLADADTSDKTSAFADVSPTSSYAGAIQWAYQNNIVDGFPDQTFRPGASVTREQFLTMLLRYMRAAGIEPEPSELTYTDADSISKYAREAVACMQTIGLVRGFPDGTVRPARTLTRAEAVTMLMRLSDYLASYVPPEVPDAEDPNASEPAVTAPAEEVPAETRQALAA